jgi:CheY-like chemotaxis protein
MSSSKGKNSTISGSIDFGYEIKDDKVIFYVKDTGIGISEELHERIFERFTQGQITIARDYEGAGLGLAICKALTDLLGGKIWYESKIGKGSTFFFSIPLNSPHQIESITTEEHQNPEILNKIKILIVEDDLINFKYFNKALVGEELIILHAENGKKAVELVVDIPDIQMVLMDIRMPVMDGFEATKQIKILRPDLPVIAQTAYAFIDERQKILSAGCDDYISKPIVKDDLLKMINKHVK